MPYCWAVRHTIPMDYDKLSYLLVQSKQLEAYGETDLVQAFWRRIIELLSSGLDDGDETVSDFIPDLPTPSVTGPTTDGLETLTRKQLLEIWNELRGRPKTIQSIHNKGVLVEEIRRLRGSKGA